MKFNRSDWVWLVGFAAIALSSCANPVTETYKKGVDGGEKAIKKTVTFSKRSIRLKQPSSSRLKKPRVASRLRSRPR
jgi:hypothetical protein